MSDKKVVVEYGLVVEKDMKEFDRLVLEHLRTGMTLHGGVSIAFGMYDGAFALFYAQSLIRVREAEEQ